MNTPPLTSDKRNISQEEMDAAAQLLSFSDILEASQCASSQNYRPSPPQSLQTPTMPSFKDLNRCMSLPSLPLPQWNEILDAGYVFKGNHSESEIETADTLMTLAGVVKVENHSSGLKRSPLKCITNQFVPLASKTMICTPVKPRLLAPRPLENCSTPPGSFSGYGISQGQCSLKRSSVSSLGDSLSRPRGRPPRFSHNPTSSEDEEDREYALGIERANAIANPKLRRREKNRLAAQRSRARKSEMMDALQRDNNDLTRRIKELEYQNQELYALIHDLRSDKN